MRILLKAVKVGNGWERLKGGMREENIGIGMKTDEHG